MVREGAKKITLAVGDGANDVSMIQVGRLPIKSLGFLLLSHILGPDRFCGEMFCKDYSAALQETHGSAGTPRRSRCQLPHASRGIGVVERMSPENIGGNCFVIMLSTAIQAPII